MIATHNIKVNGRWYMAGEEYEVEEPRTAAKPVAVQEEPVAAPAEEPQASFKPRTASTRRKAGK